MQETSRTHTLLATCVAAAIALIAVGYILVSGCTSLGGQPHATTFTCATSGDEFNLLAAYPGIMGELPLKAGRPNQCGRPA
jgi:hypothetical protein